MSRLGLFVDSAGYTLLELLLVTSIVATLAAISVPVTAGAMDEVRAAMAARYLEGRILHARAAAVRRSTPVALRFAPLGDDYQVGEYVDGNGNGVRTSDIASGVDPEVTAPELLGSRFPGVAFGLQTGIPDVDGDASATTDGVRIGVSRILTLGPDGTATSGTLYVRGRRGQYGVRILGATARTRVLRFHPGTRQWTLP